MTLEQRLKKRAAEWRRMALAFRAAQSDCDPDEEEYSLNMLCAETLERCVAGLSEDLERSAQPETA